MPITTRVRGFLFGLFGAILIVAWTRSFGIALGADSLGRDLVIIALLSAGTLGCFLGSLWVQKKWTLWWPAFAVCGILAALIAILVPSYTSQWQQLFHAFDSHSQATVVTFFLIFSLALLPAFFGGVAFARTIAGAAGEIFTPLAFGAAMGLLSLDYFLGPIFGGPAILVVSGVGFVALSVGLGESAPLVEKEPNFGFQALIFSACVGFAIGLASRSIHIFFLQFSLGTQNNVTWIYTLLLFACIFGAVGFGSPLSRTDHPLLWSGFFAALAGGFIAFTTQVIEYLAVPKQYLFYFNFFGATEGSFLHDLLLVASIGGLTSLAVGACFRCISDAHGRPTAPMLFSFLGLGWAAGHAMGVFNFSPETGIIVAAYVLIISGILSIFLIGQVEWIPRIATGVVSIIVGVFGIFSAPDTLTLQTPLAAKAVAITHQQTGPDGIAALVRESGQEYRTYLNHNDVSSTTPALEKLETMTSLALANNPRELLLLNSLTPKRFEFFKQANVESVDLSPVSPLLGELSLKAVPNRSTPLLQTFRAPAGVNKTYPLILSLPEPLWNNSLGLRWNEHTFDAMKDKLDPTGIFMLWFRGRDYSPEVLGSLFRSFARVFPSTEIYVSFVGFDGPDFALLGSKMDSLLSANESILNKAIAELKQQPIYSDVPLANASDIRGLKIGDRDSILDFGGSFSRIVGPLPHVAWDLKPSIHPREQAQGLEFINSLAKTGTESSAQPLSVIKSKVGLQYVAPFADYTRTKVLLPGAFPSWGNSNLNEHQLDLFLAAYKNNPSFTPGALLWEQIAARLIAEKQWEKTARIMLEVYPLQPKNSTFRLATGISFFRLGRLQEALPHLNEATTIDGEDPEGWYHLGECHLQLGEYDLALTSLQKAHELDPRSADIMVSLAYALIEKRELEQALNILELARKIAPHHPRVQEASAKLSK